MVERGRLHSDPQLPDPIFADGAQLESHSDNYTHIHIHTAQQGHEAAHFTAQRGPGNLTRRVLYYQDVRSVKKKKLNFFISKGVNLS